MKAQVAPTQPGARPQQLGSSPWPQEPASGRPKREELPLSTNRCELFSFLWLEGGHPGSAAERTFRIESLKNNQDRVYSEGFKQALAAYYANGSSLPRLLEQVRQTRTLGGLGASVGVGRPRR